MDEVKIDEDIRQQAIANSQRKHVSSTQVLADLINRCHIIKEAQHAND